VKPDKTGAALAAGQIAQKWGVYDIIKTLNNACDAIRQEELLAKESDERLADAELLKQGYEYDALLKVAAETDGNGKLKHTNEKLREAAQHDSLRTYKVYLALLADIKKERSNQENFRIEAKYHEAKVNAAKRMLDGYVADLNYAGTLVALQEEVKENGEQQG